MTSAHTYQSHHKIIFQTFQVKIKKKSFQKDLGAVLSDDLKWYEHIKNAVTKARIVLWMVKRSKPMLSLSAELNIHKSTAGPILIYGSNVWYPNIQCCKIPSKIPNEGLIKGDRNFLDNLTKCKILHLTLYLQDLLTMSKCLHGHYDQTFNDYIYLRDSDQLLRSSDCLGIDHKKPKKNICRYSFFYRTGALINRLPKSVNFNKPSGTKTTSPGLFLVVFQ